VVVDQAVLGRIDEIITPSAVINPTDSSSNGELRSPAHASDFASIASRSRTA
jgi:hypothetical protein